MMGGVRLLVLLGALQGSLSQIMYISQIPFVIARPGSTATLQCSYTINTGETSTIGWSKWYKHKLDGPEVTGASQDFKGRVTKVNRNDFFNKRSANIVLHRVVPSDTGIYFCQVVLQLNEQITGYGNGTFLMVEGTEESEYFTVRNISLIAGAVVTIIFIAVAVYVCATKKVLECELGIITDLGFQEP
ncbi:natural cytotoxicity triggering receptor 3-like [Discoglossus pictus]